MNIDINKFLDVIKEDIQLLMTNISDADNEKIRLVGMIAFRLRDILQCIHSQTQNNNEEVIKTKMNNMIEGAISHHMPLFETFSKLIRMAEEV